EADLVSAAPLRPRQRREPARHRPSRVRRVALARLLRAARGGNRLQARSLSPSADGVGALFVHASADAARAPLWLRASGDALVLRKPGDVALGSETSFRAAKSRL